MEPNLDQLLAVHNGDASAIQDAAHDVLFSVRSNDHRTVITPDGEIYSIGPEPQPHVVERRYLWFRWTTTVSGRGFGLGFGGSEYTIVFNDGTQVVTHNLWHRGSASDYGLANEPSNGYKLQRAFWGNNLRMRDEQGRTLSHLLQPPPSHIAARYRNLGMIDFFSVLDVRLDPLYTPRPKPVPILQNSFGVWQWVIWKRRFVRFVDRAINSVICTKCCHARKRHWTIGDEETGPIDWGCSVTGCDC